MTDSTVVSLKVGPAGRVVIPSVIRRKMGIAEGDRVTARLAGETLILENPQAAVRRIQQRFAEFVPPNTSLTDELLTERREESRREQAELG